MKKILTVLSFITILFSSCATPVAIENLKPGQFGATRVSADSRAVSLGTIEVNNSTSVYFILKNVGDYPITDVAFTVSDPANFNVSPGTITQIDSDSTSSVLNLIRVDVNHGEVVGKSEIYNYISKTVGGVIVSIAGRTTDGTGAVIPVALDVDLRTIINVTDVSFYAIDNGNRIEFPDNLILDKGNESMSFVIKNTGTVPFDVSIYASLALDYVKIATLIPEQEIILTKDVLHMEYNTTYAIAKLIISGSGTVFPLTKYTRSEQVPGGWAVTPIIRY